MCLGRSVFATFVAVVAATILGGCSDQQTTALVDGPPALESTTVAPISFAANTLRPAPGSCRWSVPGSFNGLGPQSTIRDFMIPCFVPESLFVRVSIQGTFTASANSLVSGWALQPAFVNGGGTFGPMGSAITSTWMGGLHGLKLVGGTNGVVTTLGASAAPGSQSQNVTYFVGGFGRSQGGNQSILLSRNGFGGETVCPCPPPVGTSMQRVSHYVLFSNIVVDVSPEPNNLIIDQLSPSGQIVEGDSVRLRARGQVQNCVYFASGVIG
jgi:hypothetical protein